MLWESLILKMKWRCFRIFPGGGGLPGLSILCNVTYHFKLKAWQFLFPTEHRGLLRGIQTHLQKPNINSDGTAQIHNKEKKDPINGSRWKTGLWLSKGNVIVTFFMPTQHLLQPFLHGITVLWLNTLWDICGLKAYLVNFPKHQLAHSSPQKMSAEWISEELKNELTNLPSFAKNITGWMSGN